MGVAWLALGLACAKDDGMGAGADATSSATGSASETSASTGAPSDPEAFCAQFTDAQSCPYGDEAQMIWCEWVEITPVSIDNGRCVLGEPLGECLAVTGGTTVGGCVVPPGCESEPYWSVVDGEMRVTFRCGGSPPLGYEPCTFVEPITFEPAECGCLCDAPMATSGDGSATGDSGGGGDPSYPAPDGSGACPAQTAPIELPGASVCAPFCAGAGAMCPPPASGDAVPECTPFEQPGGSGTPCTDHPDCTGGEACGPDGTCIAVAFWACRLTCEGGETCSDGMTCTGGACGYL